MDQAHQGVAQQCHVRGQEGELCTSEEQNFDLAKLISIRVWYVHADQINFIS
jgi:hypothetical protein